MRQRITYIAAGSIEWQRECNVCADIIEPGAVHFYVRFDPNFVIQYNLQTHDYRRWHLHCLREVVMSPL